MIEFWERKKRSIKDNSVKVLDTHFGFTAEIDAGDGTKRRRTPAEAAAYRERLIGANLGLFCREVEPVGIVVTLRSH